MNKEEIESLEDFKPKQKSYRFRVYIGNEKSGDNRIYLKGFNWDCGWYWGGGYVEGVRRLTPEQAREEAREYWTSFFEESNEELGRFIKEHYADIDETEASVITNCVNYILQSDGEYHGLDVQAEGGNDVEYNDAIEAIEELARLKAKPEQNKDEIADLEDWLKDIQPQLDSGELCAEFVECFQSHTHFSGDFLGNNKYLSDTVDNPQFTDDSWWRVRELYSQFYTVRKAADMFHSGARQTSQDKIDKEKSPWLYRELNEHIENVIIPEILKALGLEVDEPIEVK